MSEYNRLKSAEDFTAFTKQLYFPPGRQIEELELPKMRYISFAGTGSPRSVSFQGAVQSLYGVAFGIEMGLKFNKISQPLGYFDFKVPPLEGLWWQFGEQHFDMNNKDQWECQLMIMMPAFVTQDIFSEAVAQAKAKHPKIPYARVVLGEFDEGKVIQTAYIGPYSTELETVERLLNYGQKVPLSNRWQAPRDLHERPAPQQARKLKTVLRYGVKESSAK